MRTTPFGRFRPALVAAGYGNEARDWEGAHRHETSELYFLRQGTGRLLVDKDTFPLRYGDLVVLNRGVRHDTLFAGEPVSFYSLSVDAHTAAEGNILRNKRFCIVPTGEYGETVGDLFGALVREREQTSDYGEPIAERLLQLILLYAFRLADTELNRLSGKSSVYDAAKEFFDAHFFEAGCLSGACERLGVSKFYLSHVFKEHCGLPPVRYIANKRMELAEKLLAATDRDVADIAAACGYADAPYFCRVFKRHAACTPLQYRYNSRSRRP